MFQTENEIGKRGDPLHKKAHAKVLVANSTESNNLKLSVRFNYHRRSGALLIYIT